MFEVETHNLLDQIESIYQRKANVIDRAKCDEDGNKINDVYIKKETEKITQANKLNVVPDEGDDGHTYHEFSFKINNTSYAFPPVNVFCLHY